MRRLTAESMVLLVEPPNERLATAGVPAVWCETIQSRPATILEVEPLPSQPKTRTLTRETSLAIPVVRPPIVPATWVPCPWQSLPSPP